MQKRFIIIGAVLVVVLLVAVWVYLFFNARPDMADDLFGDFGQEGEALAPLNPSNDLSSSTEQVNLDRPRLRQLTTKPVAGYNEVLTNASSTPEVYYVESGTGHIFSINLETGTEKRVSATTFANADTALISEDGAAVAVASDSNQKTKTVSFGNISTSTESVEVGMIENVLSYGLGNDGTIFFATQGTQGAVGYMVEKDSLNRTNIFSVPFFDAKVIWGEIKESPIFIYPKASYLLEGYLYEVKAGSLSRLPAAGFGFNGFANKSMIVYNSRASSDPSGYIYNRETRVSKIMDAPVYPEKCTFESTGFIFYCAHEPVKPGFEYPDSWYKGKVQYKDSIYLLNGENMSGELIVDTYKESGRELDIINMTLNNSKSALYFINKNDQTLWMYEL